MDKLRRRLPPLVVRRLPKYLAYVQELAEQRIEWVSSHALAEQLGLTSSTVRQDFSFFDFRGTSKRGYEVAGLQRMIESVLGNNREWRMVIVGAGNLGKALVLHEDFGRRGFKICGIFDSDPAKLGQPIGVLTIQGLRELPAAVNACKATIGVIAVPAPAAQQVADLLIASGVSGLLNLALTHLSVPQRVAVIDSRIVAGLLELTHLVTFSRADEEPP
jgi:redox-sensing transcriptional repressor